MDWDIVYYLLAAILVTEFFVWQFRKIKRTREEGFGREIDLETIGNLYNSRGGSIQPDSITHIQEMLGVLPEREESDNRRSHSDSHPEKIEEWGRK